MWTTRHLALYCLLSEIEKNNKNNNKRKISITSHFQPLGKKLNANKNSPYLSPINSPYQIKTIVDIKKNYIFFISCQFDREKYVVVKILLPGVNDSFDYSSRHCMQWWQPLDEFYFLFHTVIQLAQSRQNIILQKKLDDIHRDCKYVVIRNGIL